jgi:hypothetical protein
MHLCARRPRTESICTRSRACRGSDTPAGVRSADNASRRLFRQRHNGHHPVARWEARSHLVVQTGLQLGNRPLPIASVCRAVTCINVRLGMFSVTQFRHRYALVTRRSGVRFSSQAPWSPRLGALLPRAGRKPAASRDVHRQLVAGPRHRSMPPSTAWWSI